MLRFRELCQVVRQSYRNPSEIQQLPLHFVNLYTIKIVYKLFGIRNRTCTIHLPLIQFPVSLCYEYWVANRGLGDFALL